MTGPSHPADGWQRRPWKQAVQLPTSLHSAEPTPACLVSWWPGQGLLTSRTPKFPQAEPAHRHPLQGCCGCNGANGREEGAAVTDPEALPSLRGVAPAAQAPRAMHAQCIWAAGEGADLAPAGPVISSSVLLTCLSHGTSSPLHKDFLLGRHFT